MRPMCGIDFWRVTWLSGVAEEDNTAIHRYWRESRERNGKGDAVTEAKDTDSVKDSTSDKKEQRGKGGCSGSVCRKCV